MICETASADRTGTNDSYVTYQYTIRTELSYQIRLLGVRDFCNRPATPVIAEWNVNYIDIILCEGRTLAQWLRRAKMKIHFSGATWAEGVLQVHPTLFPGNATMSFTSTRRAFILSVFAVAALPMAGCGKSKPEPRQVAPYEGQYKNAKGEVVLEIKEGTVRYTNPNTKTKSETSYMVQGTDKLFVESDVGEFTLVIAPDGSITGLPAAIAGGTAPIKKS